jgi:transposase, IS5 family
MSEQRNSTSAAAPSPLPDGHVVSIRVANDHPLLQLKRALSWEAIQAVMVKYWRKAGRNVDGGPGLPWPVDLYVPLLVLMSVKTLDSRQMEHHLEENVVARLFLGIEDRLSPRVRDHSNIARAQASLSVAGWQEVNELIVGEATRLGFGQMEILSSDTTVQEPAIGYPNEAGIMRGVAQRVYRSLVKVKERGVAAVEAGKEQAKAIFKTVKEYHLLARTKEQKDLLLQQLVAQTQELLAHSQEVIRQVGRSTERVTQAAVRNRSRLVEVSAPLLPQIMQWLQTGVVATGKIVHAGITQARAIVKNKVGKRVEFGLKWLIHRLEGGYVFGRVVEAGADERAMPVEALKDYQRVLGAQAVPKMSVYDRGGSAPKTIATLKQRGVEKVGIQPRGKAHWDVAEADQPEVRSQRGKTEGVIGTLKSRKYGFNHRTERSNETLIAAGQRAMACLNLNTLMRDVVGKGKTAQGATA